METSRPEILKFAGVTIAVCAAAEVTGVFSVIEERPPLFDTRTHIHANEDEYFHSIDGEHIVHIGDDEHRLGPGEGAFAPRGVPHSQRRVDPGVGHMLIIYTPGGFEGFFRRLAAAEAQGPLDDAAYAAASEEYGITWL